MTNTEFEAGNHSCRACGAELTQVVADLGLQPASNAYLRSQADFDSERRFPLRAVVCSRCLLVQVDYDVPPEELFSDYSYFSSYSQAWLEHARHYASMAETRFALSSRSLVVELASNDGYLLRNFVDRGIPVLGIDPADTVAAEAERVGVPTLVEFFGAKCADNVTEKMGRKPDLIIANNVMAHVPDLNDFVEGIARLLRVGGTVTVEFPHLLHLMERCEFDTIYHEHFSYFSLHALASVLKAHGLDVYDVEELKTHGGSLRIYAAHVDAGLPRRHAVNAVLDAEVVAGLTDLRTYEVFSEQVKGCRAALLEFFKQARLGGKRVAGYGAAAKGNTLLNYCGISSGELQYVADLNPHKQSKFLPGSHVPIVTPDYLLKDKPEYVLILPWNLEAEIVAQLAEVRAWGGQFVVAIPSARVF